MKNKKVTMEVITEINKGRIADLLCSAFEGGVKNWCTFMCDKSRKPFNLDFSQLNGYENKIEYPHCHYPLFEGGRTYFREFDEFGEREHYLDLEKIQKGLYLMANKYPKHFANFISENDDAETGNVFVQCCVFGEIKYD